MRYSIAGISVVLAAACGSAPEPRRPGECQDQASQDEVHSVTPKFPPSTTPAAPPEKACEEKTCKGIDCAVTRVPNGTACTAVEEWVEGPTHCWEGQCLSRRICAKACFFEIVVAMKADHDEMLAECPERTRAPEDFEECVMQRLNPTSKLAKRVNHQIHDCMVTCGYPALLSESEILEYEENGVRR